MADFKIPGGKECREFIVARFLWDKIPENVYKRYYVLGVIIILYFLFMEYITGQFQSPTMFATMMSSIFLFLAVYAFFYGYREKMLEDLDMTKRMFMEAFTGKAGRRADIGRPFYCDSKYNDTDCDYLMMSVRLNSLMVPPVWVYIRGDVVQEIVPFPSDEELEKKDPFKRELDHEEIKKRLDMCINSSTGDRKDACLFAKYLLTYHPDMFEEAFGKQPLLSLRFLNDVLTPRAKEYFRKKGEIIE